MLTIPSALQVKSQWLKMVRLTRVARLVTPSLSLQILTMQLAHPKHNALPLNTRSQLVLPPQTEYVQPKYAPVPRCFGSRGFGALQCTTHDTNQCDTCNAGFAKSGVECLVDTDGDGTADVDDDDDDNDGVLDTSDSAPLVKTQCVDSDGDVYDDCAVTGLQP